MVFIRLPWCGFTIGANGYVFATLGIAGFGPIRQHPPAGGPMRGRTLDLTI